MEILHIADAVGSFVISKKNPQSNVTQLQLLTKTHKRCTTFQNSLIRISLVRRTFYLAQLTLLSAIAMVGIQKMWSSRMPMQCKFQPSANLSTNDNTALQLNCRALLSLVERFK